MKNCLGAIRRDSYFWPLCLLLVGILSAVDCYAQSPAHIPQNPPASQRTVTFLLKDHLRAQSVALAGTFNNWSTQSTLMIRKGADWSASIKLAPGTYRYKFVVDGDRWTVDPENSQTEDDGEGHINSVIVVDAGSPSASLGIKPSKLKRTSFHRRLDVGGHKLYINCEGEQRKGVPTVVMDAGMGNSSESWLGIQPKVAEFARVCIYDRAGLGNSDPATHTRTITQIVVDLHNLLARAAVPVPRVLVGHSLGGINVRWYASMYPREVVGMVLVDSAHEEQFARMEALIPEEIKKQFPPSALEPMGPEKIDFKDTERRARISQWHADIPLIVLTAANARPNPPGPLAFLAPKWEEIRQELQQDLVHRSARGKQIIATRSGHFIHHDEPELVVSAIREVVDEARAGKRLK
ncbi:MAG TPA: alpha/beta fold hydrolase [Pyrinomonadaceae bacterium]|nr:alpha/beta fold hydrolase [Pyrinomonadaceae bacterium]